MGRRVLSSRTLNALQRVFWHPLRDRWLVYLHFPDVRAVRGQDFGAVDHLHLHLSWLLVWDVLLDKLAFVGSDLCLEHLRSLGPNLSSRGSHNFELGKVIWLGRDHKLVLKISGISGVQLATGSLVLWVRRDHFDQWLVLLVRCFGNVREVDCILKVGNSVVNVLLGFGLCSGILVLRKVKLLETCESWVIVSLSWWGCCLLRRNPCFTVHFIQVGLGLFLLFHCEHIKWGLLQMAAGLRGYHELLLVSVSVSISLASKVARARPWDRFFKLWLVGAEICAMGFVSRLYFSLKEELFKGV